MAQQINPGSVSPYVYASKVGATLDCVLTTGAKIGGGTPTDNTAALNAVLATASVTSPVQLLLDGPTACTGLLIATAGHTTIEGLGWDTGIWINSGSNKQPISNNVWVPYQGGTAPGTQGQSLTLRNFYINGNRGNGTTGDSNSGDPHGTAGTMFYAGVDLANIDNVLIDHLWVYNAPVYQFRIVNCNNMVIQNCRIENPTTTTETDGIHIDGPISDVRIDKCWFSVPGDDNIAMNAPEGLAGLGNISRVTVSNCIFYNGLTAVRCYAYVNSSKSFTVSNVVITNCTGSVRGSSGITAAVFALGEVNTGSKPLDAIANWTASNCQFTSDGYYCRVNDPVGVLIQDNCAWLSPTNANPWVGFQAGTTGGTTISDLQFNNCKIYRNSAGSAAAYAIQTAANAKITKVTFNGFSIDAPSGTAYTAVPYLIDIPTGGSIGQLVINSIDSTNITALVNPGTLGFAGITTISGPGVLATGWQIPDSVMANNTPYISATGANAGKACVKIAGVVQTFGLTVAGGFSLSVSPATGSLYQSSSIASTLTFNTAAGYSGTITPSVSGLPTGVTASFSPATLTLGSSTSGTITMTLTGSSSATAGGPTTAVVSSTDGTNTTTANLSLTVLAGPIQQWLLNEGTGSSFADSSGNANTLTASNITFGSQAGLPANAASFNGSTSYLTAANATNTNFTGATPFSFSVWATFTSLTVPHTLVSTLDTANNYVGWEFGLEYASNTFMDFFVVSSYSGNALQKQWGSLGLAINTLYHFVVTYDGSKSVNGASLYVNGSLASSFSTAFNSLTGSAANTKNVRLGMRQDGTGGPHSGYMADARIFTRALSQAEVTTLYTNGAK